MTTVVWILIKTQIGWRSIGTKIDISQELKLTNKNLNAKWVKNGRENNYGRSKIIQYPMGTGVLSLPSSPVNRGWFRTGKMLYTLVNIWWHTTMLFQKQSPVRPTHIVEGQCPRKYTEWYESTLQQRPSFSWPLNFMSEFNETTSVEWVIPCHNKLQSIYYRY